MKKINTLKYSTFKVAFFFLNYKYLRPDQILDTSYYQKTTFFYFLI